MKIKELRIDVFGGVRDRQISFSDGLNVIVGENESGKSTTLLFIKFMLYGMPRKGHEDRDRSINREEHCARGSMTLSFEGEEYRIERSFTESGRGGSEKKALYRLSDGAEVFGDRQPWEVFLGVPREVFESSSFVGQLHSSIEEGKKGSEAIRNLLSSADESTDLTKVEAKLDKIRVGYRHKTGRGGRLPELADAIHEAKSDYDKAVNDRARLLELEDKSRRLHEEYGQVEKKLEEANGIMHRLGQLSLVARFDALAKKREELTLLAKEREKLLDASLLTEAMPKASDAERLRLLADRLEEAEETREEAEAALDALDASEEDTEAVSVGAELWKEGGAERVILGAERLRGKKRGLRWSGFVCILLGLFGAFAGAAIWQELFPILISVGIGLLGILLFWRGGVASSRLKALAASYGVRPSALAEYLRDCEEAYLQSKAQREILSEKRAELRAADAALKRAEERLAEELSKTLPEEDVVLTAEAGRDEADRLCALLDALGVLTAKHGLLTAQIREEERALSQYDEASLRRETEGMEVDARLADPKRAEWEQRYLKEQREQLGKTMDRVDVERISLAATVRDPMPLLDHVQDLSAEYERAEEYYKALELALEAFKDAGQTMSGTVTPILGKRAGEMMEFLSGGRYPHLFSGNDFQPSLESEKGIRVPTELLSGGTRDAAYLCLRLSLMLQIYEGELPPLMMDESLCQLDETRMGRMLRLLGRLCENRFQCLLFTCHKREVEYCREEKIDFLEIGL